MEQIGSLRMVGEKDSLYYKGALGEAIVSFTELGCALSTAFVIVSLVIAGELSPGQEIEVTANDLFSLYSS